MTTDTTPQPLPSRDDLVTVLVDLLIETPALFSQIGEALRQAAPLIAARRDLDALPVVDEP